MQRPNAAGMVLQALEPMVQKLTELEALALGGGAMPVVEMIGELVEVARGVVRRGAELVLQQAAWVALNDLKCPKCDSNDVGSHGFEPTSFTARVGRVAVSRRRFRCDVCKHSWFEFDARWGLPEGDYTDDVREATERLACRLGYREAVDELKYLWGVAPDSTTADRWVIQDGQRAEQATTVDAEQHWKRYEEREHAVAAGEQHAGTRAPGFGVVEVDGVHVLAWKPGREPRRKAANDSSAPTAPTTTAPTASAPTDGSESSGRIEHQAPSTLSKVPGSPMGPAGRSPRVRGREVCMGLTYLGEDACEESPGRGVLLDRRYVGTLNNREGFWTALHAAAKAQGALDRQALVRLSDGGGYFVDRSAELFRDQPMVGILDIQHARQHVWEAGHKVVADKNDTSAWVKPHTEAIRDGRVGAVIIDLAKEREQRTVESQREAIDSLHGYLDRHQQLMDYPRYRKAGYPIASAAVESANKRLVGRRFKQGGMIWSEPGIEAMVALRLAFYNPGAWHRLWPHADHAAAAA
jgi:hypothetical protein